MTVKISDPIRNALIAVALCDIGIGLILIGTIGLGPTASLFRDVVGWLMIAQAIPNAIQAIFGRMHRAGEELLLVNVGFIAFAAIQIAVTGNAPVAIATAGEAVLVTSAGIATTLLWSKLSGRRLGRKIREARTAQEGDRP